MGIGLGGFIDGIALHQILQWHHMLTSTGDYPADTVAGLEKNTLVDGFFHLSTWIVVALAMTLTLRKWKDDKLAPPWRAHFGLLLVGWGAFNLVEGVIDHEILAIHHVRDDFGGPIGWDLGFLAFGLVRVVVGLALTRNAHRRWLPGSLRLRWRREAPRLAWIRASRVGGGRRQRWHRPDGEKFALSILQRGLPEVWVGEVVPP